MKFTALDALPLFSDDLSIGAALLGRARASEWRELAPLLEGRGLPKMDELLGGRYVPAVRAFFDRQYGLAGNNTAALRSPDGIEDLAAWKTKKHAHKRRG